MGIQFLILASYKPLNNYDTELTGRLMTLYVRYYNKSIDIPTNNNNNIVSLKRLIGEELGKLNSLPHEQIMSYLNIEYNIQIIEQNFDEYGIIILRDTTKSKNYVYQIRMKIIMFMFIQH